MIFMVIVAICHSRHLNQSKAAENEKLKQEVDSVLETSSFYQDQIRYPHCLVDAYPYNCRALQLQNESISHALNETQAKLERYG